MPRTETTGAWKKLHSNGTPWTETSGCTQADKHTEPGLEHPGKKTPGGNRAGRTGTSGGQKPGTGTAGEEGSGPGKERPASRAEQRGGGGGGKKSGRPVKENMDKNKERMGDETKNMNRYERREGEEGAAQKETTGKARRRKKVGTIPRTATSGARKKPHSNGAPWTGTPGGRSGKWTSARNPDWNIWGGRKRQAPGQPRVEHPGGRNPRMGQSIRGTSWNGASRAAQGGRGRGGKKSGRSVKESMNKNKERRERSDWRGDEEHEP